MTNDQSKEPVVAESFFHRCKNNWKSRITGPIQKGLRKHAKKYKFRLKFVAWDWMLLLAAIQLYPLFLLSFDYLSAWYFGLLCLLSLLLTLGLPAYFCGPGDADIKMSFGSKLRRLCLGIGLISWCIAVALFDVGVWFAQVTYVETWPLEWGRFLQSLNFLKVLFYNAWFQIAALFACIAISVELLRSSGEPVHSIESGKQFRDKFGTQLSWLMTGFFTLAILSLDPVHHMVDHDKNAIYKVWHEVGLGIFVAAFVSLVFDIAYHDSAFMKHVNKIEESVEGLSGILGYLNFRDKTFRAYETATDRIISINDYWGVDLSWWENEEWNKQISSVERNVNVQQTSIYDLWFATKKYAHWEKTPLFRHMKANTRVFLPKEIKDNKDDEKPAFPTVIFAGAVPYPQQVRELGQASGAEHASKLQFSKEDFRRFLGVMWRIVLAHKLRTAVRSNEMVKNCEVPITVSAATVPIMTTVVDDLVWLLIVPADSDERNRIPTVFDARGIHVSEEISSAMQNRTGSSNYAAAVTEMVMSYLRGAHSAREYVQSIFILATNMAGADVAKADNPEGNKLYLYDALTELGLDDWADWEVKQSLGKNSTGYGKDITALKVQALEIADQFMQTLKSVPNLPSSGSSLKNIQDALF